MHFYSFRMKEKMRHKEMEEIRAYKFEESGGLVYLVGWGWGIRETFIVTSTKALELRKKTAIVCGEVYKPLLFKSRHFGINLEACHMWLPWFSTWNSFCFPSIFKPPVSASLGNSNLEMYREGNVVLSLKKDWWWGYQVDNNKCSTNVNFTITHESPLSNFATC